MSSVTDPAPARLGVSRRTLTRGAAWTAPLALTSVAAPAFAASPGCVSTYLLNWDAVGSGGATNVLRVVTVTRTSGTGAPVDVTFAAMASGTCEIKGDNFDPKENNVGGLGTGKGMMLHIDHADTWANRQTVNVSFSRPVTGLSFTITDIDSKIGDYWDRVELSGMRNGARAPSVVGAGTQLLPWQQLAGNTEVKDDEGGGNVAVTYGAPTQTFTLDYYSGLLLQKDQKLYLSDFTFTTVDC